MSKRIAKFQTFTLTPACRPLADQGETQSTLAEVEAQEGGFKIPARHIIIFLKVAGGRLTGAGINNTIMSHSFI